MQTIKLTHEWHIGAELTSGGYGKIHAAKSETGDNVIIKLIPKLPGAGREILFENLKGTPNVLPLLETGEWGGFWVIVMPRADKSLREHLSQQGGALPIEDVIQILIHINTALVALQGKVVHRDLKPENILLWEGQWYLADFGIARYAEATTSTETWKFAKTWTYAAPEQWRGERATGATDVYATGVIAYELLSGEHPFKGPEEHNYREQHLNQEPTALQNCPPPLATLVTECLFKAPRARPMAQNILARLQQISQPSSGVAQRLQQVDKAAAEKRASLDAIASAEKSAAESRSILAASAEQSLNQIMGTLKERLSRSVSQGTFLDHGPNRWAFKLSEIELGTNAFQMASPSSLDSPGVPAPFEVIAFSSSFISIPTDPYGYEGRSHSLWYCDAVEEGVFRWYETAFMYFSLSGKQGKKDPFFLNPDSTAGRTLAPIFGTEFQIAWPFTPIDQGQEEEFFERWMNWFADAAEGRLRHPTSMPERKPIGSWRTRK